jgi:Tol biopolymer transport system component
MTVSSVLRVGAIAFAGVAISRPAPAQTPIQRMSVDSNGVGGDAQSGGFWSPGGYQGFWTRPSISQDGRWVAFDSDARNLAANDTNYGIDVFVHDRQTGATLLISIQDDGSKLDYHSFSPSISPDGRFVAYSTSANFTTLNDWNFHSDVFVHDRDPDGNGVFDEGNAVTAIVSLDPNGNPGDGDSQFPSISADGNVISFRSTSTNLVSGDMNGVPDIFVHDRTAGTTTRVTVTPAGRGANDVSDEPVLSSDGSAVAYSSLATNLDVNDTNGMRDIFVYDIPTGIVTRVNVSSTGAQAIGGASSAPSLSADGMLVAFDSCAPNLVPNDPSGWCDCFMHDRSNGTTIEVSFDSNGNPGNWNSLTPALSADGTVVAFSGWSDNLVRIDENYRPDLFVRDLVTGILTPCSSLGGVTGDEVAFSPAISGDGRSVGYVSYADNLALSDTNATADILVRDLTIADPVAAWTNYGTGFPGTNGIPGLTATSNPLLGTTTTLDVGNSLGSWSAGLLLIGFAPASVPTKYGGTILVDQPLFFPFVVWPAGSSLPLDVPADPLLTFVSGYLQVVETDAGAAAGLSFSPGLALTLGG